MPASAAAAVVSDGSSPASTRRCWRKEMVRCRSSYDGPDLLRMEECEVECCDERKEDDENEDEKEEDDDDEDKELSADTSR
jgi:hypothetical protein